MTHAYMYACVIMEIGERLPINCSVHVYIHVVDMNRCLSCNVLYMYLVYFTCTYIQICDLLLVCVVHVCTIHVVKPTCTCT